MLRELRTWADLDAAPRHRASRLLRDLVPIEPGVYFWYRNGKRMYVGKADSLRARVFGNHLGQSTSLTSSAFRRNVAEHLDYGSATAIKKRQVELTAHQLAALVRWIRACDVAWLTCGTKAGAIDLERKLKVEFKPPLTKR